MELKIFWRIAAAMIFLPWWTPPAFAQVAEEPTAILKNVRSEGQTVFTEGQVTALSGMQGGAQIGKKDLQAGADRLVQSGLFAKVSYAFQTRADGVYLTFKVSEAPRMAVYFDNFPWFADSELGDVIRKKLPFFDGTLPEAGKVVDDAGAALAELLASRGMDTAVEHQVIANPLGDGKVQEFRISGAVLQIAKIEFGDPALESSKVVRQHLPEIQGKAYSRMTIDLFLAEQIRPVYAQQGYLRAQLGPPEVRLSGNPNQKLPDQLPVFVPVKAGPMYRWQGARWSGNNILSTFALNDFLAVKSGDIANGMALEAGLDKIREEYARRGYLEARVEPTPAFDDQNHTVTWAVPIAEGRQYKFGKLVLTGISPGAEKRLRAAWPNLAGEVFDKAKYEEILVKLQTRPEQIFVDLPFHFEALGHWLQPDPESGLVDALLDFK